MGILGSKEDLGQAVVVYGYNPHDFGWKNKTTRSVYHTCGLIVDYEGKKYVVTTRTKLVSCQNIVMYHCYFERNEPILKNDLKILFQSIEYNIIILGTKGHDELVLSASEILNDAEYPKTVCPSVDILSTKCIKPNKKAIYHTLKTDIDLESKTIKYDVHIYEAKFIGSLVYDQSYLPDNFMYRFRIVDNNSSLVGIYGSPIFNRNHELVGTVSKTEKDYLYVLPTKAFKKVVMDFVTFRQHPKDYQGPLTLPFTYEISGNNALIDGTFDILTTDGPMALQKDDKIISIGSDNMLIKDNISIFDPDYKEYIPLDIYLRLNLIKGVPINLVILRKKKILNFHAIGTKMDNILELTNVPHFNPRLSIPFININGLIIVQLTQELIDTTMYHKITIRNKIVDEFLENSVLERDCLLIIDCLNNELTKKYILPKLTLNKQETIACPYILAVNGNEIRTLAELETVLAKTNKISIEIQCYGDGDRNICQCSNFIYSVHI